MQFESLEPIDKGLFLDNPYKGNMPNAKEIATEQQYPKVVNAILFWDEIEPQEGEINWAHIENPYSGYSLFDDNGNFIESTDDKHKTRLKFDYWRQLGTSIVIRVVMENGGEELPKWLIDKTKNDLDGGSGVKKGNSLHPNYYNPKIIEAHESLIRRLAERYNDDPYVIGVQIGSIGMSGEWQPDGLASPNAKLANQYVYPYFKYFTKKQIIMRTPYELAKEFKTGLYNDGLLADGTYDMWQWTGKGYVRDASPDDDFITANLAANLTYIKEPHPSTPDFWKYNISTGEVVSWKTSFDANGNFVPEANASYKSVENLFADKYLKSTLRQLKTTHVSFFGMNYPFVSEENKAATYEKVKKVLNASGYRLYVSGINIETIDGTQGRTKDITVKWKNIGVAPFYFDWDVEYSLIDSDGNVVEVEGKLFTVTTNPSISRCLPDFEYLQSFRLNIPESISGNDYKLAVSIVSPYDSEQIGKNSPEFLLLANEESTEDGRYIIAENINIP